MAVKRARIGTIDAQIKRNRASFGLPRKPALEYTRIVAPMAVTQITTLQGQTLIAAQRKAAISGAGGYEHYAGKRGMSGRDHLRAGRKHGSALRSDRGAL